LDLSVSASFPLGCSELKQRFTSLSGVRLYMLHLGSCRRRRRCGKLRLSYVWRMRENTGSVNFRMLAEVGTIHKLYAFGPVGIWPGPTRWKSPGPPSIWVRAKLGCRSHDGPWHFHELCNPISNRAHAKLHLEPL
jgi:hypothetical protein